MQEQDFWQVTVNSMTTTEILKNAKDVCDSFEGLGTEKKNEILCAMADCIQNDADLILKANELDVEKSREFLSDVMIDRLKLTRERIFAMADGIRQVAKLDDPVGKILEEHTHQNGMTIKKVSVPIGVVAIIYESRPNVTSDAAALAFKSGNVCILRGGKEAYNSSKAIVEAMHNALLKAGIPKEFISLIEDTSRDSAREIMTANDYVDILIPRGGKGLISSCVQNATVPCIQTGTGICHIYVDKDAELDMAVKIIENAKTSRPSVCNACEVCLVHKDVAEQFLPMLEKKIGDRVEFRLCSAAQKIINGTAAAEDDFDTEFLDYILGVKIVDDVDEALLHITKHSTHHSEAIVTENNETAEKFLNRVDSSSVYHNASTRFTDGGEFGLGCEMGISTQKLHARGPMGLKELTTYKYVISGNGNIR